MTTVNRCRVSDTPITAAPDNRLHNSGYGRPPEAYCTPAVASAFVLELPKLLSSWKGLSPEDADAVAQVLPRHERYPRALIARYANTLNETLGGERNSTTDPMRAIAHLARRVIALRLIEGVVLTCDSNLRYKVLPWVNPEFDPSPEQVAVALVATAYAQCPLVIWSGEPSMSHIKPHQILQVRWLRRSQASQLARDTWSSLATAYALRGP